MSLNERSPWRFRWKIVDEHSARVGFVQQLNGEGERTKTLGAVD
jgi:hypothetical protein